MALDDAGTALLALIPEVLADFEVDMSAALDEVVVTVRPEDVPDICRMAKEDPRLDLDYLRCLSVVDREDRLEVVYHLFSLEKRHRLVVKTFVPPDEPHVPSVVPIWRGADWFEREGHDLYGVVFQGHPDLAPLLLYEGFEGYPGRRSFPLHDYDEW